MKAINHDNWLLADTAKGQGADSRKWRDALLSIRHDAALAPEIVGMFEAARGALLYGYFFQPMLAMGVEQCYRVLERGARLRCAQAGMAVSLTDRQGKSHPHSFGHNLRALAQLGLIAEADLTLWQQARELRDWVVAPEHQSSLTLDHGVTALSRAAELLGRLFRDAG
jgi:hypothetical protein